MAKPAIIRLIYSPELFLHIISDLKRSRYNWKIFSCKLKYKNKNDFSSLGETIHYTRESMLVRSEEGKNKTKLQDSIVLTLSGNTLKHKVCSISGLPG
ncbi:hypothetical protein ACKUB1_15310 [Methanospirillum stamsii]|uniref:hypothetical protein n=1 Tax=Methanospirillum stamsii TaxID=1277351 RepID=UPI0015E876E2|nr:hypothetical protein [Methanospirillum stamsii]